MNDGEELGNRSWQILQNLGFTRHPDDAIDHPDDCPPFDIDSMHADTLVSAFATLPVDVQRAAVLAVSARPKSPAPERKETGYTEGQLLYLMSGGGDCRLAFLSSSGWTDYYTGELIDHRACVGFELNARRVHTLLHTLTKLMLDPPTYLQPTSKDAQDD